MNLRIIFFLFILVLSDGALAGVDGAISGTIVDQDQAMMAGAKIQLVRDDQVVKETISNATGEFGFFPVNFGVYRIVAKAKNYVDVEVTVTVASGAPTQMNLQMAKNDGAPELVVNVKEKRNLVLKSASGSQQEISHEQIEALPQGDNISLPKLLSSTTPGVVQGPFGQMFIRGNHANIQYQIDGVQLPDSTAGTFGDSFSPRNIDHMEVITGGIPAEYGERLAAVMNIITKAGPEKPGGEVEIDYGVYNAFNTISPQVVYGGSDKSGRLHYFSSFNFRQTDRGLDTPEPESYGVQSRGGTTAQHDESTSYEGFFRVDDQIDNVNKFTLTGFYSNRSFQIPNYPGSFKPTDPFFQAGYTDQFGNSSSDPTQTTFNYVPPDTNDIQQEQNTYAEFVWKRTLSEHAFLQLAPYFKESSVIVLNDLSNDLATSASGSTPISGSQPSSFALNRVTDNFGIKTDFTWRVNDQNLFKSGIQVQDSNSQTKNFFIQTDLASAPFTDSGRDTGYLEALYAQDSYSPIKSLTLNLGLRYSATQFLGEGVSTSDGLLQPRFGVEYLLTDRTKLHGFYGKLFQPAPFEDLRKAFSVVGGGQLTPYDVKAEKDDYYEIGVTQQLGEQNVVSLTYYYKDAKDMLDDTQLANTSIAQPYNFAKGFANGIELSLNGRLSSHLSHFVNYSHEDAKGQGLSGGIFAFSQGTSTNSDYQTLDHVQTDTFNAGVTYSREKFWSTLQGLYGSGLRTGPNNSLSLPSHLTFDATIGYKIKSQEDWWSGVKLSVDVLNITDNIYPITIANGFNGSHYAAGREIFLRAAKEF